MLQCYDIKVKYAQTHKMASSQVPAECQYCDCEGQPNPQSLIVTTPSFPPNHHFQDDNACLDLPKVYVNGCSYHHESQIRAMQEQDPAIQAIWQVVANPPTHGAHRFLSESNELVPSQGK